jgi:ubiquinone/menaquinone biosynthesis C-methylase UbiE
MITGEREQVAEAWDGVAAGYEEVVTPMVLPLAEEALGRIGLRPGVRLLDVAAGTGALSIPAARLGAQVVATDISPAMTERFQARARAEGLANVEGRVMDAHALDFDDATFDVVASQAGISLLPDLGRGLREMVRVTKPGGRVLVVAFGPPQKAEFLTFFLAALKATIPGFAGPPSDPPPPQFQLADPATFRERLVEAGLKDVSMESLTFATTFRSAAHLWDLVMGSNPIGPAMVADVTNEQRAEARRVLDGMLRERSGGDAAATLNADFNIGIGTK